MKLKPITKEEVIQAKQIMQIVIANSKVHPAYKPFYDEKLEKYEGDAEIIYEAIIYAFRKSKPIQVKPIANNKEELKDALEFALHEMETTLEVTHNQALIDNIIYKTLLSKNFEITPGRKQVEVDDLEDYEHPDFNQ